jgi:CRISPR-associated endonuclease/helicase Cas3
MLDEIYEPFELNNDNLRENFREYLDNLYPYNVYEESEEEFFSQFDGIEVLPKELEDEFIAYINNKQFIEAEKLFVSISKKKFARNKENIYYFQPNNYGKIVPVIYLKYSHELGLLNEKPNINNITMIL